MLGAALAGAPARRCSSTSPTTRGSVTRPRPTSTSISAGCARSRPGGRCCAPPTDGVTALIAHDGAARGALPQFRPGVLTGTVEPRVGPHALRATRQRAPCSRSRRSDSPPDCGDPAGQQPRGAIAMTGRGGTITREGERLPPPAHELTYLPLEPPEPGRIPAAGRGLLWLRIPLPMELAHINVWLLEDGGRLDAGGHRHGRGRVPRGLAAPRGAHARRSAATPDLRHARPPRSHGPRALARGPPRRRGLDAEYAHRSAGQFLATDSEVLAARIRGSCRCTAWRCRPARRLRGAITAGWYGGLPPLAASPCDGEVLEAGGGTWRVVETAGHCRATCASHDERRRLLSVATRCCRPSRPT